MESARQYNVHEGETHLSRILKQDATGEDVLISKAGKPVGKVVPLYPEVKRTGRGSLRGRIHIRDDFDDLPDDIAEATKDWRIIEPSPKAMRVVSSTYDTAPLAEDGKNLGAVLGRIFRSPESWYDFTADAVALLPDLAEITLEANAEWGQWDVWLQHKHEHPMTPSTASAGTLRVLALLAAAHDPAHEGVLMIEEPENGLHPSRVPQLLSRLRARTSDRTTLAEGHGRQTLVTSHSPVALAAALQEIPEAVVFLDTVTRFGDGLPPRRLTRARKVADDGDRGTFVTPLEVRKFLDPVGRFARGA